MKRLKQKSQSTYQINIPVSFIDHCNINNIDLVKYYQWKLHLKKEQQKTWEQIYGTSNAR